MGKVMKTTEQFKVEIKILNPNIEILGEYISYNIKILAIDKRCNHEWNASISSLQRGGGCTNKKCIEKRKSHLKSIKTHRVGENNYNTLGSKMTIINYRKSNDIDIQFQDGAILKNRQYGEFLRGTIISPYDKTTQGVGFLGEGKYKSIDIGDKENKNTKQYIHWSSMLLRCYDSKLEEKRPTYKNVSCDEQWHNFQIFAKWYDDNYYEVDNEGNRIYNPDDCCFVPERINTLFCKSDGSRGDLPIGVVLTKNLVNKYRARCQNVLIGEYIHIGVYPTIEEAFSAYKRYKENYIKEVADYYKNKIPHKLYDAMYKYKVEITD